MRLSLTDYFTEKWPKSTFRPMWSMCFTTPGEITTIKEIHVHCLECWMKYIIVYKSLGSGGLPEECMDFARRYTPDLYKMIIEGKQDKTYPVKKFSFLVQCSQEKRKERKQNGKILFSKNKMWACW